MTQIPRARGERQGGQRDTESTARTRPVLTKFKGQGETCTTAGQDRSVQSRNTGMQRSCPQRLLRGASSRPRDGVLLLLGETLALPPLPLPLLRLIPVRSATLRHSLDARAWPGLKPTTGHVPSAPLVHRLARLGSFHRRRMALPWSVGANMATSTQGFPSSVGFALLLRALRAQPTSVLCRRLAAWWVAG